MKNNNFKKGFTLVEVIVALFIFILIMSSSSIFFASLFRSYGDAKDIQENLENAQYAMNLMAKTFRTSSVADLAGDGSYVQVIDYSQNDTCIRYTFSASGLIKSIGSSSTDLPGCRGENLSGGELMTSGQVSGRFEAVESDGTSGNEEVGKITVLMSIESGSSQVNLQTTTSLRDYVESGISL